MLACIKETTGTISVKVCRMKYQDSTRFTRKSMQYQLAMLVGLTKNRLFFRYSIYRKGLNLFTNKPVSIPNQYQSKGSGYFSLMSKFGVCYWVSNS